MTTKLALGTVQFGLPYGILRSDDVVSDAELDTLLASAYGAGVDLLDTAAAYGNSELRLGQAFARSRRSFEIVSKTIPIRESAITDAHVQRAVDGVRLSLDLLATSRLDAVLVHHAGDLLVPGGERLFNALGVLKADGLIGRIGVSVYDPAEVDALLSRYPIEIVQLPLNVLDQRFVTSGTVDDLARRNIEIHVRSVFLQGILLTEPERLPARFVSLAPSLLSYRDDCAAHGLSLPSAAFAYVMSRAAPQRIVVGVDSLPQLQSNVAALGAAATAVELPQYEQYACLVPDLTDPRRWSS
jgi:aryl-alcohol dehydrogenase-like predicted oxidoreductase